jgi:hypothetical protein
VAHVSRGIGSERRSLDENKKGKIIDPSCHRIDKCLSSSGKLNVRSATKIQMIPSRKKVSGILAVAEERSRIPELFSVLFNLTIPEATRVLYPATSEP